MIKCCCAVERCRPLPQLVSDVKRRITRDDGPVEYGIVSMPVTCWFAHTPSYSSATAGTQPVGGQIGLPENSGVALKSSMLDSRGSVVRW